jgi:hypothetical protein
MRPLHDLTQDKIGIALWCIPAAALIAGLSLPGIRFWLWGPSFLVMGIACVANARQCHRTHCYLTGPLFLTAAAYVGLAALRIVPLRAGLLLNVVFALTLLAFLAEIPLGRYRRRKDSG